MNYSKSQRVTLGVISIIFGLLPWLFIDINAVDYNGNPKLIFNHSNIFIEYYLLIAFANCSLFFIILGIYCFNSKFKSHAEMTKFEQERISFFTLLLILPLTISTVIIVNDMGTNFGKTVIFLLAGQYLVYFLIKGYGYLNNTKSTKST